MIDNFLALNFYETGMIISNSTSMIMTTILLFLNIYWHIQQKK